MEEARKKLRICLIFVVTLAVMAGCIYYFNDIKKKGNIDGGTLVTTQTGKEDENVMALRTGKEDGHVMTLQTESREAEYGIK